MTTIEIISVNTSSEKGTVKIPVPVIDLTLNGIGGDAHAGNWHRQVSLLGTDSIKKMEVLLGYSLEPGAFAENITTSGFPLFDMKPLDRLISGELILEVTQIGKECHGDRCAIFRETGECIMPKEGIFARVLEPGQLRPGDSLRYQPKVIRIGVITVSDRASRGEYEDRSGPLVGKLLENHFSGIGRECAMEFVVVPDEAAPLEATILKMMAGRVDMIFTTGGTGLASRDITPDVVRPLIEKEISGIMEMIRVKYGKDNPNALLSRSIAGVTGNTLMYVLPGSTGAVKEYCAEIVRTLEHTLYMLHGLGH